jgi:hypothetical protein
MQDCGGSQLGGDHVGTLRVYLNLDSPTLPPPPSQQAFPGIPTYSVSTRLLSSLSPRTYQLNAYVEQWIVDLPWTNRWLAFGKPTINSYAAYPEGCPSRLGQEARSCSSIAYSVKISQWSRLNRYYSTNNSSYLRMWLGEEGERGL